MGIQNKMTKKMSEKFRTLFKQYRKRSRDPETSGDLTQGRLADLLSMETGLTYTTPTVNKWENGKRRINTDDRHTLIGLLAVFYQCSGITTRDEAAAFLSAEGYWALSDEEIVQIEPQWLVEESAESPHATLPTKGYVKLIGRSAELAGLLDALQDESKPIIALHGLGGIGKTALAQEAIDLSMQRGDFEHVVWTSAKTERFVGEGVERVEVSDFDFEQLMGEIGRQCNRIDIAQMPIEQKREAVKYLLADKRVLIVLDNLETVPNARDLLNQLADIRGQSKTFITTRHIFPFDPLHVIRLQGLPEKEGLEFLRFESQKKGVQEVASAPEKLLLEVHAVTGGAPLAMKLVIGQLFWLELDEVLTILKNAKFEERDREFYRFVFKQSWDLLKLAAQKVLVSTSTFSVKIGGTKPALKSVSRVDDPEFSDGLRQLVFMSLINPTGTLLARRYTIHQLTHYFIMSDIVKKWG